MSIPDLAILIPAAGASRRMEGRDKLAELVDGTAVLRRTAEMALEVSASVAVTLPSDSHPRAIQIADLSVTRLPVPGAAEGMAASLRAGASWALGRALMILPADMPDLTTQDLRKMADAARETPAALLRATAEDGTPGHPVVFPAIYLPDFADLAGDQGARDILAANASAIRFVPLPQAHALTDLDTPQDWAAWRKANPGR